LQKCDIARILAQAEGQPEGRNCADQRRAAHRHRDDRLPARLSIGESDLPTLKRQPGLVESPDHLIRVDLQGS